MKNIFNKIYKKIMGEVNPVKTVCFYYGNISSEAKNALLAANNVKATGYGAAGRRFGGQKITSIDDIIEFCPSGSTIYYLAFGSNTPYGVFLQELVITNESGRVITYSVLQDRFDARNKRRAIEVAKNKAETKRILDGLCTGTA